MSRRTDTLARYGLLALAACAILAMYIAAGGDSPGRSERFSLLTALGGVAALGWPGTALSEPYEERRPLRLVWGKPTSAGEPIERPTPAPLARPQISAGLRVRPTLVALVASIAAAVPAGIVAFALAGGAGPNEGGIVAYVVLAAAIWLTARSALRLVTARRALRLGADGVTLGTALGYIPPLTIERNRVAAIESAAGDAPKLGIVTAGGRRYEITTTHLTGVDLVNIISAIWPEVPWRRLGAADA